MVLILATKSFSVAVGAEKRHDAHIEPTVGLDHEGAREGPIGKLLPGSGFNGNRASDSAQGVAGGFGEI